MSRSANASVVYCSLWTHIPARKGKIDVAYSSGKGKGKGKAKGYGYDKCSAALSKALCDAGYTMWQRNPQTGRKTNRYAEISGVGDYAIDEALKAIADYWGFKNCIITRVG